MADRLDGLRDARPQVEQAGTVTLHTARAPGRRAWTCPALAAVLCCSVLALLLAAGPFATNDGPVHMSFARMFWFGPSGPLQNRLYVVKHSIDPNLLAYLIVGPMLPIISSGAAESILQAACLVGVPLAAWFAMAAFGGSNAVLVILAACLSLNQLFCLGLYNYSLSTIAALAAFGTLVRAERTGGAWWLGFSAALMLCFIAHAAGLIMAAAFSVAWLAPGAFAAIRSGGISSAAVVALVRKYRWFLLAIVPTVLLAAQFALRQKHSGFSFGPRLLSRYYQLLSMDFLAANGFPTRVAAWALSALIIALAAWAAWARLAAWRQAPQTRLDTVRFSLLILAGLALVTVFPDTLGGGWSHVRRMLPLPYFAAILLCSAHPWPINVRRWVGSAAGVILLALFGSAMVEQVLIKRGVEQAQALLQQVREQCTVLPLIPASRRIGPSTLDIAYNPLFQIATAIEDHGGRAGLFNFLARLDVYPVAYLDGHDPHRFIFHWRPAQPETDIDLADIAAFEQATGITVDYLLVQDAALTVPGLVAATANDRAVSGPSESGLRLYVRAPEQVAAGAGGMQCQYPK